MAQKTSHINYALAKNLKIYGTLPPFHLHLEKSNSTSRIRAYSAYTSSGHNHHSARSEPSRPDIA